MEMPIYISQYFPSRPESKAKFQLYLRQIVVSITRFIELGLNPANATVQVLSFRNTHEKSLTSSTPLIGEGWCNFQEGSSWPLRWPKCGCW